MYVERKLRRLGHMLRSDLLRGLANFIPAHYWGDMSPVDVADMARDRPRWDAFVQRVVESPVISYYSNPV
jgi:hypothetical protein